MDEFNFPGEKIFEWSTVDLTDEVIDIGLGGRMPTLDEWLTESLRHPTLLINLEVKGPLDPVTWMTTFDYAFLIFAGFWGYVFFGEIPDATTLVGMVFIACAGIIVLFTRPLDRAPVIAP